MESILQSVDSGQRVSVATTCKLAEPLPATWNPLQKSHNNAKTSRTNLQIVSRHPIQDETNLLVGLRGYNDHRSISYDAKPSPPCILIEQTQPSIASGKALEEIPCPSGMRD